MGGITTTLFQRPRDPQYNLTTLLLPGNGTNGTQNNTFLDSSSNNFSITRNPSTGPNAPTQGTFTPFSQTGWGNNFNSATADWINSSSAASPSGTEDFTVECWYFPTSKTVSFPAIFSTNSTYNVNTTLNIYDRHDAFSTKFSVYGAGVNGIASTTSVVNGVWYHIAVTRQNVAGTYTLRLFVNGVLEASSTSASGNLSSNACYIGRADTASLASTYLNGQVSNFRITRGGALYINNFTPSTTPLTTTVSAGTVSFLACQSNRFVDNSANSYAITLSGTPSVQAFSPFAPSGAYTTTAVGGSGYFDGTGDFLSFTPTNFNLGTDAFTVEGWVYLRAYSFGSVISSFSSASGVGFSLSINNSGIPEFLIGNGSGVGAVTTVSGTTALPLNAWVYLAATKTAGSGGTMTLYVNGSSVGTPTTTTRSLDQNLGVVARYYTNLAGNELNGYIASARVSNTVRTITVPTEPYTSDANTLVLFNFTNAGITDATAKNDLETVGNAQISTTQSKFGGSSMSFDGTGDYLIFPNSQNFALGSGDFTVEAWVYVAASKLQAIMDTRAVNSNTTGIALAIDASNFPYVYVNNATLFTSSTAITLNTWTHLAMVRSSGTITLYINGTKPSTGSAANTTNLTDTALTVGSVIDYRDTTATLHFNGYIDDLRITKGFARYTANFNVPTVAFPTQ